MTRMCPDSMPWRDYQEKPAVSTEIIRKVGRENGLAYFFLCIPNLVIMFYFTDATCSTIGRPAPGAAFWALAMAQPVSMVVHYVLDVLTYSYIAVSVTQDHKALQESLVNRALDCRSALLVHRTLNRRVKRVVRFVSAEITVLFALSGLGLVLCIYDYFVMPWGHWSLLLLYVLQCLGFSLFLPLQWKAVNDAQSALVELVADALGRGPPLGRQPLLFRRQH